MHKLADAENRIFTISYEYNHNNYNNFVLKTTGIGIQKSFH